MNSWMSCHCAMAQCALSNRSDIFSVEGRKITCTGLVGSMSSNATLIRCRPVGRSNPSVICGICSTAFAVLPVSSNMMSLKFAGTWWMLAAPSGGLNRAMEVWRVVVQNGAAKYTNSPMVWWKGTAPGFRSSSPVKLSTCKIGRHQQKHIKQRITMCFDGGLLGHQSRHDFCPP